MDDINLADILERGTRLYNTEEICAPPSVKSGPQWICRQRAVLLRKLGKASDSEEDRRATSLYSDVGSIIDARDVNITTRSRQKKTVAAALNADSTRPETAQSVENWFVSLLRTLVGGVLHSRWKRRHGSCLSLVAIVEGMGWTTAPRSGPASSSLRPLPAGGGWRLPLFLAQDILAACVSVLLLDRYMDISGEESHICSSAASVAAHPTGSGRWASSLLLSPVKEAAAELICVVGVCHLHGYNERCAEGEELSQHFFSRVVSTAIDMCRLHSSQDKDLWRVVHSGLVLLKHLLRHGPCLARICASPHMLRDTIAVVCDALKCSSNDDITGAAAEALVAGAHLTHAVTDSGAAVSLSLRDKASLRALRVHVVEVLQTAIAIIPTVSGIIASSVLVAVAKGLCCSVRIWQLFHLTEGTLDRPDDVLVALLALQVSGDLLTRFVELDVVCAEKDVDLCRALPIVMASVLQTLRATEYLRVLSKVPTMSAADHSRLMEAATRLLCKIFSVPLFLGLNVIGCGSESSSGELEEELGEKELVHVVSIVNYAHSLRRPTQSASHLLVGDLMTSLLKWYFAADDDTTGCTSMSRENGAEGNPIAASSASLGRGKRRSQTEGGTKPARRRAKKRAKYCDDPEDDADSTMSRAGDSVGPPSHSSSLALLSLSKINYSAKANDEHLAAPVAGRGWDSSGGVYFSRLFGLMFGVLMQPAMVATGAMESITTVLMCVVQLCTRTLRNIEECVSASQSLLKEQLSCTPVFSFSDPSMASCVQGGHGDHVKTLDGAVSTALRLSWVGLQAVHVVTQEQHMTADIPLNADVDEFVASIVMCLDAICSVVQSSAPSHSTEAEGLRLSVSLLLLYHEFGQAHDLDSIRRMLHVIAKVQSTAQREFYVSILVDSLEMHHVWQCRNIKDAAEQEGRDGEEYSLSAEDMFDVVDSFDLSATHYPDSSTSPTTSFLSECHIILDILR